MTLLDVSGLVAGYGPVQVLHGIDFTVDAGEAVVVLGANGAGKTTTLRALSGMLHCKGSATFDGQSLVNRAPSAIARLGIAHVPQGRGTFTELTVEENLRLGAYARRDKEVDADIDRWFDVFPRLRDRSDQNAGSMSGGEQQMLAIARAMMARPRLVLLDEPSLGLAPIITQGLFAQLAELNRELGVALLIVEQNAMLALSIASRGYVLETGEIVATGTGTELQENDEVRRAYLGV
ncbi:MAG TPA: ABC transporter ATP-binding protein [Acidimicrobiia bacterium]|nr:ABC transporter ATP-binding protein [Acidimicrobiia bacterium]